MNNTKIEKEEIYIEDTLDFVLKYFTEHENVDYITDYKTALIFLNEYNKDFSDYYGIDIQSDVNEYIIEKDGDKLFCIEPLKHENKILGIEAINLLIDKKILNNNEKLLDNCDVEEELVILEEYNNDDCLCNDKLDKECNDEESIIPNEAIVIEELKNMINRNDCLCEKCILNLMKESYYMGFLTGIEDDIEI